MGGDKRGVEEGTGKKKHDKRVRERQREQIHQEIKCVIRGKRQKKQETGKYQWMLRRNEMITMMFFRGKKRKSEGGIEEMKCKRRQMERQDEQTGD